MDTKQILEIVMYVLVVLELTASVGLTILVLSQSSEESDLGSIAGKTGTYLNKNGNGAIGKLDQLGEKYTKWFALAWAILAFALVVVLKVISGLE